MSLLELAKTLKSKGFVPLPVVPPQDAALFPARYRDGKIKTNPDGTPKQQYTGKNPSCFVNGEPRAIAPNVCGDSLPDDSRIEQWFTDSIDRIGLYFPDKTERVIDLDLKNFEDRNHFEQCFVKWFGANPILHNAWIDKTQSGGMHVHVKFKTSPDFKTFSFEPGGNKVGELVEFAVISPTPGYESVQENGYLLIEVDTPESIGLYPCRADKNGQTHHRGGAIAVDGLNLAELGNKFTRDLLAGVSTGDDRSEVLTRAINEWSGWENWCSEYQIPLSNDSESLAYEAGEILGMDSDRVKRILGTIRADQCIPSVLHNAGNVGCWKVVKRVNPNMYELKAPADVRVEIANYAIKSAAHAVTENDKDEYAQLKLAIADVQLIDDPQERNFKLGRVAQRFSTNMAIVQGIIKQDYQKRRQSGKPEKAYFDLNDLLDLRVEGSKYLVPRFFPTCGLMLMSGFAKDGKSTLMYHSIKSLVYGEDFLGQPVTKPDCKVMLIQGEESTDMVKWNLETTGIYNDVAVRDRVRVYRHWKIDDLTTLENWITEFQPDVVFMDSLRKFSAGSGISENSAEYAEPLYELQSLFHELGILGVMIYHNSKVREATGLEKLSGSSAIAGACDYVLTLTRTTPDRTNPRRFLATSGRNMKDTQYTIELAEGDDGCQRWINHGEVGGNPDDERLQTRILNILETNAGSGEWFTVGRIRELLDLPQGNKSIYKPLRQLVQYGQLSMKSSATNKKVTLYQIPQVDQSLNTPPLLQTVVNQDDNHFKANDINTYNEYPLLYPPVEDDNITPPVDTKLGEDTNITEPEDTTPISPPVEDSDDSIQDSPILAKGGGVAADDDLDPDDVPFQTAIATDEPASTKKTIRVGSSVVNKSGTVGIVFSIGKAGIHVCHDTYTYCYSKSDLKLASS